MEEVANAPFLVLLDAPNRAAPVQINNETLIQVERSFGNKLYRRVLAEFDTITKQLQYNHFFSRNFFQVSRGLNVVGLVEDTFDGHITGELIATDPYNELIIVENTWRYYAPIPAFRLSYNQDIIYPETTDGSSCGANRNQISELITNLPVNTRAAFILDFWHYRETFTGQDLEVELVNGAKITGVPNLQKVTGNMHFTGGNLWIDGIKVADNVIGLGWHHVTVGVDQVSKQCELYIDETLVHTWNKSGSSGIVRTLLVGMYGTGYKSVIDYVHYGPADEILPILYGYNNGAGSIVDLVSGSRVNVFRIWDMSSDEIRLTEGITSGDGTIQIEDQQIRAGLRDQDRIYILTGDRLVFRKVINATEADGIETLTLDSSIGTDIPLGSIVRAGRARLCTIDADQVSFDYITAEVYTVNLTLRECKENEYEVPT